MKRACTAVGLNRASAYRHTERKAKAVMARQRPRPKRRLAESERTRILAILNSETYMDQPVREVYAKLLTEGTYLCSWRTMYRILNEQGPVRDRRAHREAKRHAVPRLEATAPHQVWTWDISKLRMHTTGKFLNLYVVLDLFSRYVVAWMVAECENSALAQQLFVEAIARHEIEPGELIVHQDRGAPMTSHAFCDLLAELGVDRSHSRPRVSNDNPHSESLFHTAKYQPDYPGRFRDIAHARQWCTEFFEWYNDDHHHSGLALFTPADVFFNRVEAVAATRAEALNAAYEATPERFVHGPPTVLLPPARVLINPLEPSTTAAELIEARPEELDAGTAPIVPASTTPVINIPGASGRAPGGAPAQAFTA